jgi:hypothetical protein
MGFDRYLKINVSLNARFFLIKKIYRVNCNFHRPRPGFETASAATMARPSDDFRPEARSTPTKDM